MKHQGGKTSMRKGARMGVTLEVDRFLWRENKEQALKEAITKGNIRIEKQELNKKNEQ